MRRAIREHLKDFVAIAAVCALGLAITVGILSQQQQPYPSWIPFLGDDRFELKAELPSAQAVTPGQGQTVNMSGIEIGDITEVDLEQGVAVVTLSIREEYAELIHRDATTLLRPRTGLQDMTLEMDPGGGAPPVEEGDTLPVENSQPNVQSDEVLASLDLDTRTYLQMLLEGGARGLGNNGEEFSAVLRRFEPTARDLAKINTRLAERRENIKRSISNLRLLMEELGARDTQLSAFVDSSNAVLQSFANQEASLRGTLQRLPSALAATRGALESGNTLSTELIGALERPGADNDLIEAAEALGPALRETRPFFERTVNPIRAQIRPFTRQAQTPVRHLTQAANALNDSTPALTKSTQELNGLFNALAYNPPGAPEGYLFWASWFNHNANSMFALQDAQGPILRGAALISCSTAANAESLTNYNQPISERPFLKTVQQLTRVPTANLPAPYDPTQPAICTL